MSKSINRLHRFGECLHSLAEWDALVAENKRLKEQNRMLIDRVRNLAEMQRLRNEESPTVLH